MHVPTPGVATAGVCAIRAAGNELFRKCIKDCDAALSLDPLYVRPYILKGARAA